MWRLYLFTIGQVCRECIVYYTGQVCRERCTVWRLYLPIFGEFCVGIFHSDNDKDVLEVRSDPSR